MRSKLCICLDSCTYKVYMDAETPNMDSLGLAYRAYSFACTTGPSIMGYLMNEPPIGIGGGMFEVVPGKELREWMPRHYSEKGYATAWLSGNPVLMRMDSQLDGALQRYFKYWKVTEYLKQVATPDIIKDLADIVKKERENPLFVFILLLDTHTPYHDGSKVHTFTPFKPRLNYENQKRSVEYVDSVFPLFLKPFKEAGRPLEIIITSDHGENYGGWGWGHNAFRSHLRFGPQLFEIPFIRAKIEDWSKISFEEKP